MEDRLIDIDRETVGEAVPEREDVWVAVLEPLAVPERLVLRDPVPVGVDVELLDVLTDRVGVPEEEEEDVVEEEELTDREPRALRVLEGDPEEVQERGGVGVPRGVNEVEGVPEPLFDTFPDAEVVRVPNVLTDVVDVLEVVGVGAFPRVRVAVLDGVRLEDMECEDDAVAEELLDCLPEAVPVELPLTLILAAVVADVDLEAVIVRVENDVEEEDRVTFSDTVELSEAEGVLLTSKETVWRGLAEDDFVTMDVKEEVEDADLVFVAPALLDMEAVLEDVRDSRKLRVPCAETEDVFDTEELDVADLELVLVRVDVEETVDVREEDSVWVLKEVAEDVLEDVVVFVDVIDIKDDKEG